MTNELAGFFMCLLGPFFEDACQLPNVILGSWEANLSPENTLISFPPGTVHVSFSFSKSSPNTQTRLRAAWADPLSPRGLIVRCSDPTEYPRPAGNLAGLQLQRFGHGEPAGSFLLSAFPRLRFCRGARLVTPGLQAFSEPNNGGYAVCRTLGAPLPSVLEETLCTVIRHHPRRVSPKGRGCALLRFFLRRMGARVHSILREPHGSWATSSRELGTHALGKGLPSTYCVLALRCAEDAGHTRQALLDHPALTSVEEEGQIGAAQVLSRV